MGLARLLPCVALLLSLALAGACIKEVELPPSDRASLYIDGAVVVDSAVQTLALGRTRGLAQRGSTISGAEVEVVDLTTGQRFGYREGPAGTYEAPFVGQLGHAYQLTVELPDGSVYRSRPDSLAALDLAIAGEAAVRRELGREGEDILTRTVGTRLSIVNESEGVAAGVLTVRPNVVWSYFDLACVERDFGDGADQCWFEDFDPTGGFTVVDLSRVSARGDTASAFVGREPIDFRFGDAAWLVNDIRRRSPAAAPYFAALARALNPTGSPFDEQPRPVTGNLEPLAGAEPMLGFFGVVASTPVYAPTAGNLEIIRQGAGSVCRGGGDAPAAFDCCFCIQSPGASAQRPSYLP